MCGEEMEIIVTTGKIKRDRGRQAQDRGDTVEAR
jgi:hypothetical protein